MLSGYDSSVVSYYKQILMRWPKITLTKHNVISYDKKSRTFFLNFFLDNSLLVETAKELCEQKIVE